ncbi:prepilin-type N-terminal cleavage/methylation domain-containing protein [Candidatus Peregrinibacteria bacterium]|nr:MAG: prepilin-type N-terminal cleavage/methylation domain-containing protein [Candidatus Peregrinibacteria bacterium]
MHAPSYKKPAFTFIELVIVILIMSVLAVTLALAYQRVQLKVRYDAHVNTITDFFQRARSYSLSTLMVNGAEPTQYYLLEVFEDGINIVAHSENLSQVLDSYTFDEDIRFQRELEIYYFPPSGELCLGMSHCYDPNYTGTPSTEQSSILSDASQTYSTEFSITQTGGFIEITPFVP